MAASGSMGLIGYSVLMLLLCLANAAFPCTVLFWVELVCSAV